MNGLHRHTIEEIFGKPVIALSAEQSSEVDIIINDKMQEVVRESNYRSAKSRYDASQCYVF